MRVQVRALRHVGRWYFAPLLVTHTAAAWGSLASVVALVLELDTVPGADTSGETVPALDGFGFVGGAVAGGGCVSHPHGQRWQ